MPAPKPKVSTFGNSFADLDKPRGERLEEHTPKGQIDSSKLNTGTLADLVEFSDFEEIIQSYVLAQLGHPVVRVELTPFQLKTCIDEATTKMSYHAPLWTKQFATFDASAGKNVYELPQYILDNLEYVVYKKSLLSVQHQAGTLEHDFFIKYFQDNFLFGEFAVGDFYLLQQNLEMIRKVLGQDGSWDVINGKFLQIYPSPVLTPDPVILEYRAIDSNTIHPAYRNWIQRFALACAKSVLGQIRGKYANLPSPGGGASLNGQQLIEEATREKDALIEELISEIEELPAFTMF